MPADTDEQRALVNIGRVLPDGSASYRWYVTPAAAEHIADHLGEPHIEQVLNDAELTASAVLIDGAEMPPLIRRAE